MLNRLSWQFLRKHESYLPGNQKWNLMFLLLQHERHSASGKIDAWVLQHDETIGKQETIVEYEKKIKKKFVHRTSNIKILYQMDYMLLHTDLLK